MGGRRVWAGPGPAIVTLFGCHCDAVALMSDGPARTEGKLGAATTLTPTTTTTL